MFISFRHRFRSWWSFYRDLYGRHYYLVAGTISTAYVQTNLQLANLFTKALVAAQFSFLLSKLGVRDLRSPDWRGVPNATIFPTVGRKWELMQSKFPIPIFSQFPIPIFSQFPKHTRFCYSVGFVILFSCNEKLCSKFSKVQFLFPMTTKWYQK